MTDYSSRAHDPQDRYLRLVGDANLLILRISTSMEILEVLGDSDGILGVSAKELSSKFFAWEGLLPSTEWQRLKEVVRLVSSTEPNRNGIEEELQVILPLGSRWLLVRAMPRYDHDGAHQGWEAIVVDTTEKRRTQSLLVAQNKRLQALHDIARAIEAHMDPTLVTKTGLRALMRATDSDCGYAVFHDEESQSLQIFASEGLSPEFLSALEQRLPGKTLTRLVIESGEGILLPDVQQDSRIVGDMARREDLRATIIVPVMYEGSCVGALGLYCHTPGRFGEADLDLATVAASQICLAARRAEFFVAEKRQAKSFSVLYRLSRELSKHLTPHDIARHGLPFIQEEVECHRMWLGIINESQSHLVGHAATGEGIDPDFQHFQVDLRTSHPVLDEALKTRKPFVVESGRTVECDALTEFAAQLNLGTLVVLPLLALGQVVGVLILEPVHPAKLLWQQKLPLLSSMASEIATVLLARRYEQRMRESEKMRMAGLLARGVAHNFNNLLQAIVGQTSLMEIQLPSDSPLKRSTEMIMSAATRGAALVRHLMLSSTVDFGARSNLSVTKTLQESLPQFSKILGESITLDLDLPSDTLEVIADRSLLTEVVHGLLVNARSAIEIKALGAGKVILRARMVHLHGKESSSKLVAGTYIQIEVEDNGIGMDRETAVRCFEPFFTTKQVDSTTGIGITGAGLGLSSAYSIAKNHGGALTVESVSGEGSVFSIFLPSAVN